MIDKGEDIIKSSVPTLSVMKKTYFIEDKKLKLSINKFYRDKERFLKGTEIILTEIMKIYILMLIKDLITSEAISLK